MEDNEVLSAPRSKESDKQPSIHSDAQCYIMDITIECMLDNSDQFDPTMMNVEAFSSEREQGEVLLFEKTSPREWKHNGSISLHSRTNEVTIIARCALKSGLGPSAFGPKDRSGPDFQAQARWDETENFGIVHLVKTELEKQRKNTGLHNQIIQEFVTKTGEPMLRLKFGLYTRVLGENMAQHGDTGIFDSPKPGSLDNLGNEFATRFELTGNITDISIAISCHQEAVHFTPEGHAAMPGRLNNLGNSFEMRFKHTGDLTDISEAVSCQQKAVVLTPQGHVDMPRWLNNLGISFLTRFEYTGDLADISEAISCQQKAVHLTPEGHTTMPTQLSNLGNSFEMRFKHRGDLTDISEAVLCHQQAVNHTPEDHADMSSWLNNLGLSFLTSFEHTGDLTDLSEAMSCLQKAVHLTPEGHAAMPGRLNNLGNSLLEQFEHTGDLKNISEAISCQQKAVHLTPEGQAAMPGRLNNLGSSFLRRFEHTGDLTDISDGISHHQRAVHLTPEGHPAMHGRLNNLGTSFQRRFEHAGDLSDISEAISCQQKAVHLTPEGHAAIPTLLNNLGNSFEARFNHTGDLTDIADAISCQEKAVHLTPEGHADLPAHLTNLGNSFEARSARTRDLASISEAISCQQKAVHLTPEGHAAKPSRLNHLGISFQRRFEYAGDLTDISEAVSCQQKAVHLTSEGHAYMPSFLNNLGNSFLMRFEHTADLTDSSEAISCQQKAVHFTPEGHAAMPTFLDNLGSSFQKRFVYTGDLPNIFEAISFHQKAVDLTPEGHAAMPGRLNNLGNSFQTRFSHTEDLIDISEAITCQQKAVNLTPDDHVNMPAYLSNLGISLETRFKYTKDLNDISEAISCQQKAVHLTPEGRADMSLSLINLGNSFTASFQHTGEPADVSSAISNYRLSATYFSAPPSSRLIGASLWAHWSKISDPSQLLEAYQTAIPLISQVAGLGQTIQKRYTTLINISELSASAAAAAFRFQKYGLALEWLEQGRSLVWSQLNNLRTPLQDLRTHNAALADNISRVARALENAGSRGEPAAYITEPSMIIKMSAEDKAASHIKLAQEWDELLTKVRAVPHFEDFLKPASYSSLLKHIPDSGPVIVINIHNDRSDALALVSGMEEPLHISLPKFSNEKAGYLCRYFKTHLLDSGLRICGPEPAARGMRYETSGAVIQDVLRQLWTFVVKPILDHLGYTESPSHLSRIWWCVAGPLASLPLHAAGIYVPTESTPINSSTLSEFAVSSYTPTVRALVERVQSSREIDKKKVGLFMISQPNTPMLPPIPGTTQEVRAIAQLLRNRDFRYLCLENSAATVNQAIANMKTHSCIHFACHAAQNTNEPLQSGFYLHDGKVNLLSIIKEQLVGADLAFLSACQTSTGNEKLSEEAVHLAAGMMAAGYRGVVATMWSIVDFHGPKIAEDFYEHLIGHGAVDMKGSEELSSEGAAHALHYAMQQIRKQLGDSESALLTWVPYVHFGL